MIASEWKNRSRADVYSLRNQVSARNISQRDSGSRRSSKCTCCRNVRIPKSDFQPFRNGSGPSGVRPRSVSLQGSQSIGRKLTGDIVVRSGNWYNPNAARSVATLALLVAQEMVQIRLIRIHGLDPFKLTTFWPCL